MVSRGVILAGGEGTRLQGLTEGRNKHTVEVAGQPMIQYPINTLKEMGVSDVTIVSSYDGINQLYELVDEPDMDIEFRLQQYPKGMADALGSAAVKDSLFVVLCGDTYHHPAPKLDGGPQLWWTRQDGMNQGAVWVPLENRIIEKPTVGLGHPVTGIRVYDQRAIDMIATLQPSDRGELELVDIDNYYLEHGLDMSYFGGFFGDMGTPDGLKRIEEYVNAHQLHRK